MLLYKCSTKTWPSQIQKSDEMFPTPDKQLSGSL